MRGIDSTGGMTAGVGMASASSTGVSWGASYSGIIEERMGIGIGGGSASSTGVIVGVCCPALSASMMVTGGSWSPRGVLGRSTGVVKPEEPRGGGDQASLGRPLLPSLEVVKREPTEGARPVKLVYSMPGVSGITGSETYSSSEGVRGRGGKGPGRGRACDLLARLGTLAASDLRVGPATLEASDLRAGPATLEASELRAGPATLEASERGIGLTRLDASE